MLDQAQLKPVVAEGTGSLLEENTASLLGSAHTATYKA